MLWSFCSSLLLFSSPHPIDTWSLSRLSLFGFRFLQKLSLSLVFRVSFSDTWHFILVDLLFFVLSASNVPMAMNEVSHFLSFPFLFTNYGTFLGDVLELRYIYFDFWGWPNYNLELIPLCPYSVLSSGLLYYSFSCKLVNFCDFQLWPRLWSHIFLDQVSNCLGRWTVLGWIFLPNL